MSSQNLLKQQQLYKAGCAHPEDPSTTARLPRHDAGGKTARTLLEPAACCCCGVSRREGGAQSKGRRIRSEKSEIISFFSSSILGSVFEASSRSSRIVYRYLYTAIWSAAVVSIHHATRAKKYPRVFISSLVSTRRCVEAAVEKGGYSPVFFCFVFSVGCAMGWRRLSYLRQSVSQSSFYPSMRLFFLLPRSCVHYLVLLRTSSSMHTGIELLNKTCMHVCDGLYVRKCSAS